MKEDLFPDLERLLVPRQRSSLPPPERQSFEDYRRNRPARRTASRHAVYLSRVGGLSAEQEAAVTATAEYLGLFFDLPVRRGPDFDPAGFRPWGRRQHPVRGHPQLLTNYLLDEALAVDRPDEALIWLAVTAWDLCSDDHPGGAWGSVFGEARYGHAAVWSLRYLGDPASGDGGLRRCFKRSCAVATHEGLHVLGLDHCDDIPCLMKGAACLSGPLPLCPPCLRKLCWNRQLELRPYLRRLHDFLGRAGLTEAAERYEGMLTLLGDG
jgi:hypothetical protein